MNAKRIFAIQIVIILVVLAAPIVGYYFYQQSTKYLKTNDAQVAGQQIVIAAWAGDCIDVFSAANEQHECQLHESDASHPHPNSFADIHWALSTRNERQRSDSQVREYAR